MKRGKISYDNRNHNTSWIWTDISDGEIKMNGKLTQCTLGHEGEKEEENKFHKPRVI